MTDSPTKPGNSAAIPLVVVNYDQTWPEVYAAERDALLERVGALFVAIEHIGSTAVPGLAAKPIIDIMTAVASLDEGRMAGQRLQSLAYTNIPTDMPRRLFLRKHDLRPGLHAHLHIVEQATWDERNERLLRDYLLEHPEDARAYGALKQQLAAKHAHHTSAEAYTRAKTALIQSIVDKARDARGLPRVSVWEE